MPIDTMTTTQGTRTASRGYPADNDRPAALVHTRPTYSIFRRAFPPHHVNRSAHVFAVAGDRSRVVVSGVVVASPATAAQPCDAQYQSALAIQKQIESHNKQPRTFELFAQRAAYDAYNARASRLNSQMAAARKNYNACKAVVRELFELDIKQDPPSPDPTAVAKIKDAAAKIPAGYTPPPRPSQPALRPRWPSPPSCKPCTTHLDDVSLTDRTP